MTMLLSNTACALDIIAGPALHASGMLQLAWSLENILN